MLTAASSRTTARVFLRFPALSLLVNNDPMITPGIDPVNSVPSRTMSIRPVAAST